MNLDALKHALASEATIARFWSRVERRGDSECWPYRGHRTRWGHASISVRHNGRSTSISAHRFAWSLANGRVPEDGLCVLHDPLECSDAGCVNPRHLRLGTVTDNNRDTVIAGRHPSTRKTTCPRGHRYDRTVLWGGSPYRLCTVCYKAGQAEAQRRRNAARRLREVRP